MSSYNLIGLMSGTSLDGIDLVYATYSESATNKWDYSINAANSYPLPRLIKDKLQGVFKLSALELVELDVELATCFSQAILSFIESNQLNTNEIHAIASHGQTVFHQPQKSYTTQIGNPAAIAVLTGIPVIGDFRTKDVLYGGQGAPLVPIGDWYLFGASCDGFLNIGGFTNLCHLGDLKGAIRAFDISPGNLPLNLLMQTIGKQYDDGGKLSASGSVIDDLLNKLNGLSFYQERGPKSLGTEWLNEVFLPLLQTDIALEDKLRTVTEHIAVQVANALHSSGIQRVLVTGGGARNTFLIDRIKHYFKGKLILPDEQLIDFKEALVFGLLGALHLDGQNNCLAAVTGASKDVKGGVLHNP